MLCRLQSKEPHQDVFADFQSRGLCWRVVCGDLGVQNTVWNEKWFAKPVTSVFPIYPSCGSQAAWGLKFRHHLI